MRTCAASAEGSTMVRVGVIGCGKISQVRHLPEYEANPHAQIVALYDVNLERAHELAERYGATAYETLDELLAAPDVDAVSVKATTEEKLGFTGRGEGIAAEAVVLLEKAE